MADAGKAHGGNDLLNLPYLRAVVFAALTVCTIFGIMPFVLALTGFYPTVSEERYAAVKELLTQYSNFGQMFGFLGALFSGGAFVGVIYAVILQRRQLDEQRKELDLTREELRRSATAQEESQKALASQAESSHLASLLNAANSLLQTSTQIYQANSSHHDAIHRHVSESLKNPAMKDKMPPLTDTVKGQMLFYRSHVKELFCLLKKQSGIHLNDGSTEEPEQPTPPIFVAPINWRN